MNLRMQGMSDEMLKSLTANDQDVLVDLWEFDLRQLGGTVHRLCNQTNELGTAVVWKGQAYEPYPIKADGFEMGGQGASNRPSLSVGNVLGMVTGLAEQFNQLVGVVVVRRQVVARFLDAANFRNGNTKADPTQEVVSKYLVERMTSLTSEVAGFELAIPVESDGSVIPSRVILANTCCWEYRGEGCGYTGRPVADRFDMPTSDAKKDECSGTVLGCQARFGKTAVLRFGGGPSVDKIG